MENGTHKLFKVKILLGLSYYVIAENPKDAYEVVKKTIEMSSTLSVHELELEWIKLIAEAMSGPACGKQLLIGL